jgi:trehalose 6-phosphate synthase
MAGDTSSVRYGSRDLGRLFREAFPGERFIVVSNREPFEHRWGEEVGEIETRQPAGGLTSALDPLLRAVGGVWIAWGSGDADAAVVDAQDRVRVPPGAPSYTLHRLWLDQRDVDGYYLGYANQFLWPLCHLRPALTRVRARHWERYRRVNRRFADAVLDEARGGGAAVWFHDYHLALAPGFVRALRPDLTLAHFWHIPWPPLEIFRVTPQAVALLEGLLANDILGFHVPSYCASFLRCAESIVGAEVDEAESRAVYRGHSCTVRPFPISIDVDTFATVAARPGVDAEIARLRERYVGEGGSLAVGVDRMDYSKGLPEKLKALDFLWERYPEFRERLTFVQVAVPSRTDIAAYDELTHKVERLVWEINDRYGTSRWRPVHLIKRSLSVERLTVLYRAADLCIVSSLQDGMNLVAKEFVASQGEDESGVLLLSRFAGAAEELGGMVEINPFDPEDFAQRIRDALVMPLEERRSRLRRLRASLRPIYDWMADIFRDWAAIRRGELPAPYQGARFGGGTGVHGS